MGLEKEPSSSIPYLFANLIEKLDTENRTPISAERFELQLNLIIRIRLHRRPAGRRYYKVMILFTSKGLTKKALGLLDLAGLLGGLFRARLAD
jgi:hypothetical protein